MVRPRNHPNVRAEVLELLPEGVPPGCALEMHGLMIGFGKGLAF